MDKNQYQIQSWINKLADLNVTPENVIQWVYTVPIGAFDKMPYCPVFLYGNAGLDKAIIQVLKNSLDPKRVDITKQMKDMKVLFNALKKCEGKLTKPKSKYNFCNEKFPEIKVKHGNFTSVRLAMLARNPREPRKPNEQ
jgi:hypothetical protein